MIERYGEDRQSIIDALQRDEWPIPDAQNRENYAPGYDIAYWISGYGHYRLLSKTAERHGVDGGRCYDFGGSSGRVCRHFAIQSDAWDVWLSDFKESSVEFVADYLPMNIKPFVNAAFPSLPLPDAYFDLAYGCSVFTHINELEIPWLLELRRILRIGGLACLSVHNDDTWRWLAEHPEDQQRKRNREWRPDVADLPEIPEGERIVVTHRDDDPYNCNVFHSDGYLRRVWGRFFKIVEIIPHSLGIQALVVCRRTA
jgi:ubiquinone/menaquinone biosynthesis C-methylase UbiE